MIFDKRGSGRSGGDRYRYAQLTADTRAAVRSLNRRRDIRKRAIALWGLSEGASICPRVAAGNPGVAAIVIVGAAAVVPARQQDGAVRNGLLVGGAGEIATRPVTTLYRLIAATDPDFRSARVLVEKGRGRDQPSVSDTRHPRCASIQAAVCFWGAETTDPATSSSSV